MSNAPNILRWRHAAVAATIVAVMLQVSCSDDPSALNSVGTQLLRSGITVKTDTLRAFHNSTFRQYSSMDGRTNLVGRFGGYTANALIQFYPSYFPQRDTVLVVSATLNLRAVTWFGDSSASFGFNAYEISRSWGQTTFRWDSIGSGFYNSDAGSVRGTLTGTVGRDTQWISVNLDTAMVRRWLRPLTFSNNYGIILIPNQNANVVRGIHSFEFGGDSLWPRLTVVARNIAGTVTDTTNYKIGQDTFVGNIDNLNANSELIYVQSGVTYRGRLMFDLSSIPRGAIINQAELTLVYSPAASRLNRFTADSAIVVHSLLSATDSSQFEGQGARSTAFLATSNRFVFDIRHQAQTWIRNGNINYGLILRNSNTNEFSGFDLFTFYNETAQDPAKRPQLIVKYTVESN